MSIAKERALTTDTLNLLLVIAGLIIAIITGDILLRIFDPSLTVGIPEMRNFRLNPQDLRRCFTVDPVFGFRPVLGNNIYNKYGTKINKYSFEKKPGIIRLLFIGDSVTCRGKITGALKQLYGEGEFEYWNAGVESFNTVQEVKFYKLYNAKIKPDHVILFFHNNDFGTTPVAFINGKKIVVYSPYSPTVIVNHWLFQESYLYRLVYSTYLKIIYNQDNCRGKIDEKIAKEVEDSLRELKYALRKDNIKFTVVILPIIDNYERWNAIEKESRLRIISILKNLNISHIDLLEVLNKLAPNQIKNISTLSTENDRWHPTNELSLYFANYLRDVSLIP